MSEVSAFISPVAATSNFRSPPVTGTASDQKKAKRQASDKKKTDPMKPKKHPSEIAEQSMSLPNGDDDHDNLDNDVAHEEQPHRSAQHQYGTRAAAAAIMVPTQANKDQEEAGMAQQAGQPAKASKTAVGADAAADADRAAATHLAADRATDGPYGIDPRTKKSYRRSYMFGKARRRATRQ